MGEADDEADGDEGSADGSNAAATEDAKDGESKIGKKRGRGATESAKDVKKKKKPVEYFKLNPLTLTSRNGQSLYLVPADAVEACPLNDIVTAAPAVGDASADAKIAPPASLRTSPIFSDEQKYYARLSTLYNGMRNTCANRVFRLSASHRIHTT